MKIKVATAKDKTLDYLVAVCEGREGTFGWGHQQKFAYYPSKKWSAGGKIIEREKIGLDYYPDGGHPHGGEWGAAMCEGTVAGFGATALEAAMRCYVASKLGDSVDVPKEMLE